MLPVMHCIAGNIARQYVHGACERVELFEQLTLNFISPDLWLPNSLDQNLVYYQIWGLMQEHMYKTFLCDTSDLKHRSKHLTKHHRQSC